MCHSVWQCVAVPDVNARDSVCGGVLQCVAVCCSMLQCVLQGLMSMRAIRCVCVGYESELGGWVGWWVGVLC